MARVARTGRSTRIDDYRGLGGEVARIARDTGFESAIGAPITIEGRLWGAIIALSTAPEPISEQSELRLNRFTDLVATAVANAESQSELAASRRRIVAASDEARRKIERDLHDGVQQQLVSLMLKLDAMEAELPDADALEEQLVRIRRDVGSILEGLVEIARGIHPASLSDGGLATALAALARRSPIPVQLDARIDDPLPDEVEVAAYYVVSEALTNVAKYALASTVQIEVTTDDRALTLVIRDDGIGGAEAGKGSGLVGLQDRVAALGRTITIQSPPRQGMCVRTTLPIERSRADPSQRTTTETRPS